MANSMRFLLVTVALATTAYAGAAPPPVTALAYRPDGKQLAVAQRGEVLLIDPGTGKLADRIADQTQQVTALAWSPHGNWLAVASGLPGKSADVRLYATPPSNQVIPRTPRQMLDGAGFMAAHSDLIHDLVASPDGKTLATCSYDRLIKLWDVPETRRVAIPRLILKDHSDAIYGISFRPDGKLLASAAADRSVKIWDTAAGKRLYSLGDATDWVYAVAWSPDGKHLAAAGVDKSNRIWEADEKEGKLVLSNFAHEKPVLRLIYSADGKTLYSLSEDRSIKAWDADKLQEKKVYPQQPESVLSFAVRPDCKQIAIGRYDGVCLLLDADSGKTMSQPVPLPPPPPPKATKVSPAFGQRGQALHKIVFEGLGFETVSEIQVEPAGPIIKIVSEGRTPTRLPIEATFPLRTHAGVFSFRLKGSNGESNPVTYLFDAFSAVDAKGDNDSPSRGQLITLPQTVAGKLDRAGSVHFFRFEANKDQEIGIQVVLPPGSKLEPVLTLTDSSGRELEERSGAFFGLHSGQAGTYALGIRDKEYRGGAEFSYRLQIGNLPVVTSYFPLGIQRGQSAEIRIDGVNLPESRTIKVIAPAAAGIGSRIPVPVQSKFSPVLNLPSLVVGEFPELLNDDAFRPTSMLTRDGKNIHFAPQTLTLPVPGTGEGLLFHHVHDQSWRFSAKKGQPLTVEIEARRIGSSLDSVIEILDAKGQPVPRAVLRSLAKTYVTFRDHDSAGGGIRMETWNEFAMDDYVLVGNELMRIRELPRNPDDDCQFYAVNGQRVGHLGTTPEYHALNSPMYKVAILPPGSTFPTNGLPAVTVYHRNDDGGPGYGKDSRLRFDPPADGEFIVRVRDARGQGGPDFGYRLTVRPPRPNFSVKLNPTAPAVWKGGALPISVTADRFDEFDGPIQVRLENLPPGFSAPPTFIEAGQTTTNFALFADAKATNPDPKALPLKLVATATIDGQQVVREASGGLPKVAEPGDIITTTAVSSVTIHPGQETRLLVHVERRNGFKGRIPVDVQGLPHGVRVLHVGLNGILVTERDTSREIVLYAEPWVQPMERPFVVLANREGKGTQHAAQSVLLKVEK
ncbi:MAG TPA: WD40 repeat domain-containing protein [Gemmataceae bacterium]|nr:WD40 repeat domain-containing protein [Gemmataceae bacterium]